jgi:hypothetical protein
MDVNTILDESLKTFSRPAASKAAQFILMLSVIDRSVLPRRAVFANGRNNLAVVVGERRVQRADGVPMSAAAFVALMTEFCRDAHALRHEVRAADAPPATGGFTIAELVNSQQLAAAASAVRSVAARSIGAEGFTFDERGWPLTMPHDSGAKSLVSAWLVHLWMQNWLKRRDTLLGDTVLMTTTAGARSRELAFRFSPTATELVTFGLPELGRLVAAWRMSAMTQVSETADQAEV